MTEELRTFLCSFVLFNQEEKQWAPRVADAKWNGTIRDHCKAAALGTEQMQRSWHQNHLPPRKVPNTFSTSGHKTNLKDNYVTNKM